MPPAKVAVVWQEEQSRLVVNMRRHGIHLAFRGNTIVAGSAIIDDAGMIEGCRHEAAGGMTDTAILVGVDMVGFLGCGETGVMTGRAVIHDAGMIEGGRQETRGHVTVAAVGVGRHMEVLFAGGGNPFMAGGTVIHDALMFEPGVGKRTSGYDIPSNPGWLECDWGWSSRPCRWRRYHCGRTHSYPRYRYD